MKEITEASASVGLLLATAVLCSTDWTSSLNVVRFDIELKQAKKERVAIFFPFIFISRSRSVEALCVIRSRQEVMMSLTNEEKNLWHRHPNVLFKMLFITRV